MKVIYVIVCLMATFSAAANSGPSFDCEKASTDVEHSICKSEKLSLLDVELNYEYQKYLSSVNLEIREKAKVLQRIWLRSRENECIENFPRIFKEGFPDDFKHRLFNNKVDCIEIFYKESLEAFSKGLILAKARVNYYSIPQLTEIEAFDRISKVDKGVSINFYMDRNGNSFISKLSAGSTSGTRADCYFKNFYDLSFLEDISSLVFVVVESKTRTYFKDCNSTNELIDWHYKDGKLYFDKRVDLLPNPRLFTENRFYEDHRFSILNGKLEFFSKLEDSDEGDGSSFDALKHRYRNIFLDEPSSNQCAMIKTGLDSAFQIYFDEQVSGKSLVDWLNITSELSSLKDFEKTTIYQSALLFKQYLAEIKAQENWQGRLRKADGLYNYRYVSGRVFREYYNENFQDPYQQLGFPSLSSCPAHRKNLRYPDKSLDEQIYNFWNRRYSDGSLVYFEKFLSLIE